MTGRPKSAPVGSTAKQSQYCDFFKKTQHVQARLTENVDIRKVGKNVGKNVGKTRRAAHETLDPLVLTTRSSGILGAFAPGTAPGLPLVSTVSPHLTPPYFMLRAMSAASPRTPHPGREFGARGGPGSAGDRAGRAARGWSGTPRGSSVAYPNISAGPSNFHRDTGCRSERPRRPVTLTLPLIAHARATGGGPECPVDFAPRYCYANSNEMSSGTLVSATCPPPLPHPECGLQDTCISISTGLESSWPTSSLTGSGKDGHRNHEQREREQPGRFGACWSAGLTGVN